MNLKSVMVRILSNNRNYIHDVLKFEIKIFTTLYYTKKNVILQITALILYLTDSCINFIHIQAVLDIKVPKRSYPYFIN